MTTPTTEDFDKLDTDIEMALFELMLAGRINGKVKVTSIRWFIERDEQPGWLLSIYGLGHDAPMELDFIATYLGEHDHDVTNVEIILESE